MGLLRAVIVDAAYSLMFTSVLLMPRRHIKVPFRTSSIESKLVRTWEGLPQLSERLKWQQSGEVNLLEIDNATKFASHSLMKPSMEEHGSVAAEKFSRKYDEDSFVLSCRILLFSLKNLPWLAAF